MKQLKGKVISDKMDKTIVVEVSRVKKHPKYERRFLVTKHYKAHDPENKHKVGDEVTIEMTRPLSKDKRWRVKERAQIV